MNPWTANLSDRIRFLNPHFIYLPALCRLSWNKRSTNATRIEWKVWSTKSRHSGPRCEFQLLHIPVFSERARLIYVSSVRSVAIKGGLPFAGCSRCQHVAHLPCPLCYRRTPCQIWSSSETLSRKRRKPSKRPMKVRDEDWTSCLFTKKSSFGARAAVDTQRVASFQQMIKNLPLSMMSFEKSLFSHDQAFVGQPRFWAQACSLLLVEKIRFRIRQCN